MFIIRNPRRNFLINPMIRDNFGHPDERITLTCILDKRHVHYTELAQI